MHLSLIAQKTNEAIIITNRELTLQSVRKNFAELRQKMNSIKEEYNRRGINLEPIEGFEPIPPPAPPSESESQRTSESFDYQIESAAVITESKTSQNLLGFYIGPTLPNKNKFTNTKEKDVIINYETGINLRPEYRRFYKDFFWETGIDAKFFNTTSIELVGFGSVGTSGTNFLLSPFLGIGYIFPISEKYFFEIDTSLGYAISRKNLHLDGEDISDTLESSYYYGAMLGFGWKWSDDYSLTFYYRLDGVGETGDYHNQLFNQVGVRLAVEY